MSDVVWYPDRRRCVYVASLPLYNWYNCCKDDTSADAISGLLEIVAKESKSKKDKSKKINKKN